MFPTRFHSPQLPNDLYRHLGVNLLELLRNEVDTFEVVDTVRKKDLFFIRVSRLSVRLNAKLHELYIADVQIVDKAGNNELSYTLYDLGSAPLETARCPRELTTRLSVMRHDAGMQAWLAANNAYNDAVDGIATVVAGDVVFVPAGMKLSEGREFFLRNVTDGAYKAIPELGRDRASTCLVVEREKFVDYHQARKVSVSMFAPVLDPRVRTQMQQHGEFLIRPTAGNPDIYEIAGRMPTDAEQDQYLMGKRAGSINPNIGRRQGKGKLLFL